MSPEELTDIRRNVDRVKSAKVLSQGEVDQAMADRRELLAEVDALWELAFNLPGGPEALRESGRR